MRHLTNSQGKDGLYITFITGGRDFVGTVPEKNVFVPALIGEFLSPLTDSPPLHRVRIRLISALKKAIEPDGSVRYFAYPSFWEPPTVPCFYPPDSDDVAVLWNLVGESSGERLLKIFQKVESFHHKEGGYRTWLSEEGRECLVEGEDPNPVDMGVQLNLLLWWKKVDPGRATLLLKEISSLFPVEKKWVWYRYAPLIPWIRTLQLQSMGVPVTFPSFLLNDLPDRQKIYLEVAELSFSPSPVDFRKGFKILRDLAKNGFSTIEKDPPLLYHSDPAGIVSRFYWSKEFGYLLWLLLYREMHQVDPEGFPF
jgi:hypothetical protein